MRKLAIVAALAIFVSVLSSHFLLAQSNGSSVEGAVQDSSGAAIRDCEVTLLNTETGGRFNTQTDGAGLYVFPTIPPGLYSLKASKEGFKAHSVTDFRVTISQHVTQNVTLEVGAVSAAGPAGAAGRDGRCIL